MVEYVVVAIMQDNGWVIVEDVVGVVVLVELRIGGLASSSSRIEKGFVMRISSWELISGSGPRRSMSDSSPLSEIISFSNRLFRVSLSALLSMTCEVKTWIIMQLIFIKGIVRVCACVCVCLCVCVCVCVCWACIHIGLCVGGDVIIFECADFGFS